METHDGAHRDSNANDNYHRDERRHCAATPATSRAQAQASSSSNVGALEALPQILVELRAEVVVARAELHEAAHGPPREVLAVGALRERRRMSPSAAAKSSLHPLADLVL